MYKSQWLDPLNGPRALQRKFQFDVRFYFARRASENFIDMKINTFEVKTDDDTGIHYVSKVTDELTKNHKETDQEIITAFMPSIPGSYYCPVASYVEYVVHLNPENENLWQPPIDDHATNVWYAKGCIGKNPLAHFMQDLSMKCKVKSYTNHSLQVTGASILGRQGFNYKQIMAVTGHKSTNSLAL